MSCCMRNILVCFSVCVVESQTAAAHHTGAALECWQGHPTVWWEPTCNITQCAHIKRGVDLVFYMNMCSKPPRVYYAVRIRAFSSFITYLPIEGYGKRNDFNHFPPSPSPPFRSYPQVEPGKCSWVHLPHLQVVGGAEVRQRGGQETGESGGTHPRGPQGHRDQGPLQIQPRHQSTSYVYNPAPLCSLPMYTG